MMNNDISFVASILIIVAFMALIIVPIGYAIISFECWSSWSGTDIEWRISKFTCQVKTETQGWIPADRFRTFD